MGGTDAAGVRRHVVSHWRAWLLIVVVVVVVNEVMDRNFFDHREHIDGDFVVAVLALVLAFFGSYFVGRLKARRTA
jgi:Co/Zn/Cd efflux system component